MPLYNPALPSQTGNSGKYLTTNGTAASWATVSGSGGLDTGMIVDWTGAIGGLPATYAWCNGQALNRTTDAALFAVISTKFGAGNGTTTFNVPDIRNLFRVGADCEDGSCIPTTTVIGTPVCSGGSVNGPITLGALGISISDGGHTHNLSGLNSVSVTFDTNGDGSVCTETIYTNVPNPTDSATTGISAGFTSTDCVTFCLAAPPFRAFYPVIHR